MENMKRYDFVRNGVNHPITGKTAAQSFFQSIRDHGSHRHSIQVVKHPPNPLSDGLSKKLTMSLHEEILITVAFY